MISNYTGVYTLYIQGVSIGKAAHMAIMVRRNCRELKKMAIFTKTVPPYLGKKPVLLCFFLNKHLYSYYD